MDTNGNINRLFVSYELALELKEKGFDNEICFGRYTATPYKGYLDTTQQYHLQPTKNDINDKCLAPLYQQVIDFFEQKYNLKISPDNTIKTKRIKTNWTREEYIQDIKRMVNLYATTYTDGNIDKWIEQNL